VNGQSAFKSSASILALWAMMVSSGVSLAQSENPELYPSKPVRLIIPFAPAGSTDLLGRVAAEVLTAELKQPFIVINAPGAGGTIGAMQVVRAKPDGYTLMLGTAGTIINNPHINPDIGYDPQKDFIAITSVWTQPSVVMVRKNGPYASLKDLIADAKRRPGALNYGSSGVGAFNHLSTEYFSSLAGIKMTHIPYNGVAPALAALMGGTLDVVLGPVTNLIASSDRLIGIAISSKTRSTFTPSVPTAAESGLPGFVYSSWGGLFAPAGTSRQIAEKLAAAVARGSNNEVVKKRFAANGVEAEFNTPAEYQVQIAADIKAGGQLIRTIGLRADK
jgi:tripartite-type tricarboxylate transporter receptor subunit TctC